jgi:hypothetical protein
MGAMTGLRQTAPFMLISGSYLECGDMVAQLFARTEMRTASLALKLTSCWLARVERHKTKLGFRLLTCHD